MESSVPSRVASSGKDERPNNTLDRTAGSHSLAAAGQRERSPDLGPAGPDVVE